MSGKRPSDGSGIARLGIMAVVLILAIGGLVGARLIYGRAPAHGFLMGVAVLGAILAVVLVMLRGRLK